MYRAANCSRYSFLPEGNEEALKQAIATIGPISVAIDATRPRFGFYRSGEFGIIGFTSFCLYLWDVQVHSRIL